MLWRRQQLRAAAHVPGCACSLSHSSSRTLMSSLDLWCSRSRGVAAVSCHPQVAKSANSGSRLQKSRRIWGRAPSLASNWVQKVRRALSVPRAPRAPLVLLAQTSVRTNLPSGVRADSQISHVPNYSTLYCTSCCTSPALALPSTFRSVVLPCLPPSSEVGAAS